MITCNLTGMHAFPSLSFALRILLLALLMAGVLVKPVIAFAGELHEAEHAQLSGDDDPVDDGSPDPIDPSDSNNAWHTLVHLGHCCSQAPALLSLLNLGFITPAATDPVPPWSIEFQPTAHPVALRPPITA